MQLRANYTQVWDYLWLAQWGLDQCGSWLIKKAINSVCGLRHIKAILKRALYT